MAVLHHPSVRSLRLRSLFFDKAFSFSALGDFCFENFWFP